MLSEYEKHIFNLQSYGDIQKAYDFGKVVHSLVLEPKEAIVYPESVDILQAKNAASAVRQNHYANWLCKWSKREQSFLWTEPQTGLPCKSLIDGIIKGSFLFDFKTTSAKTEKQFRANCLNFNYNRQAAFYLDATKGKRFVIIGVQKVEPFKVFRVDFAESEIADGRKKYLQLMKHAHRNGFFNDILNSPIYANTPDTRNNIFAHTINGPNGVIPHNPVPAFATV